MKTYNGTIDVIRLVREKSTTPKIKIESATDITNYMKDNFYNDGSIDIYESFFAIYLNRRNNIISVKKISQGGTCSTVVDIKLIAKYAIDVLAESCILCHNHPSGNLTPSQADITITKKVKAGLELFDMQVIDHIIISDSEAYYSFATEGML